MTKESQNPSDSVIALSIFENDGHATLSKRLVLNDAGKLDKFAVANLVHGRVRRVECASLREVCSLMRNLPPHKAAAFGVCDHTEALVLSQRRAVDYNGSEIMVTRTRGNFHWPDGPGVILFDYDPPPNTSALDAENLVKVLRQAAPELRWVELAVKPSTSSCIYREDGTELRGVRGQHVFAIVKNAHEIPEIGQIVADRLWLAGHGYIAIGGSGNLLERTITDTSVWQPERLIFGSAECGHGIMQRFPELYISPGMEMI